MANFGSEGKLLLPGQKLEGLAVSGTWEHIKPPDPAPRAAAAQDKPPEINEMTEPSRQEFSKLLEDLEIPENELLKKHPKTKKDLE